MGGVNPEYTDETVVLVTGDLWNAIMHGAGGSPYKMKCLPWKHSSSSYTLSSPWPLVLGIFEHLPRDAVGDVFFF